MKRLIEWGRTFRWKKMLLIWGVFLLLATALFAERSGVQYSSNHFRLELLEKGSVTPARQALEQQPVTCLLLCDTAQDGVPQALEMFGQILLDMKVHAQTVDLAGSDPDALPEFAAYQTVVVLVPNLDVLGGRLIDLMHWVEQGGSALFAMTPVRTNSFDVVAPKLGVQTAAWEYKQTESIVPAKDFLLGGGQRYAFSDPFRSSLSISLRDTATVLAVNGEENVPLIWSTELGDGCIVVDNIGIYGKVVRGFYAASYSLLGSACAYPVINGAAFYLDDFPSPVPGGDGSYIRRDYGMSIAEFYSKVWWPDLVQLAQQYDLRFTGVMIETYEDDTAGVTVRQSDTQQFRYFGSLLLRQGGELGYHGYNHQPLVLPDTDYRQMYSYHTWPDTAHILGAMRELLQFRQEVLPHAASSVYVPPSNILSAAGRELLGQELPQIRTIASTYFGDGTDLPYVQEFGVAEDGIVEQPRIVSGSMVGDDYMRMAAVSELNMHYVSTHFMHPDDLLDVDRGAADGWETYKAGLTEYLDWLETAAPQLRHQTGTECAAAIQRYAQLTVSMETTETAWTLSLGNFVDEAWLLFRANAGTPGSVTGGHLTRLTGDLYLLEATAPTVTIRRQGGETT